MSTADSPAKPHTGGRDGEAQLGPHRFPAGRPSGVPQHRGARFEADDWRDARLIDCDLSGTRVRDGWLVDVKLSGFVEGLTVNGVDVTQFVNSELDRRHPERVQFRAGECADDLRATWDTVEELWRGAVRRAGRLPEAALSQSVDEEWSFQQTLQHLIFLADAWLRRTVLDEPMPYHSIGLPQSWYPAGQAAEIGIDLSSRPSYGEVLSVRQAQTDIVREVVHGLTDEQLGRRCNRAPAPDYPDEQPSVLDCVCVVLEEEIDHYRFASRDLAELEAGRGEGA